MNAIENEIVSSIYSIRSKHLVLCDVNVKGWAMSESCFCKELVNSAKIILKPSSVCIKLQMLTVSWKIR